MYSTTLSSQHRRISAPSAVSAAQGPAAKSKKANYCQRTVVELIFNRKPVNGSGKIADLWLLLVFAKGDHLWLNVVIVFELEGLGDVKSGEILP